MIMSFDEFMKKERLPKIEETEPKTLLENLKKKIRQKEKAREEAVEVANEAILRHIKYENKFEGLVATIKDRIKDLGDKYKAILVDGKTITTEELVLQAGIKAYEEVLVLLGEKEKRKCPRCEAHKQQHSTILTDLGHCQRVTCNYCGYYYDIGKENKKP